MCLGFVLREIRWIWRLASSLSVDRAAEIPSSLSRSLIETHKANGQQATPRTTSEAFKFDLVDAAPAKAKAQTQREGAAYQIPLRGQLGYSYTSSRL